MVFLIYFPTSSYFNHRLCPLNNVSLSINFFTKISFLSDTQLSEQPYMFNWGFVELLLLFGTWHSDAMLSMHLPIDQRLETKTASSFFPKGNFTRKYTLSVIGSSFAPLEFCFNFISWTLAASFSDFTPWRVGFFSRFLDTIISTSLDVSGMISLGFSYFEHWWSTWWRCWRQKCSLQCEHSIWTNSFVQQEGNEQECVWISSRFSPLEVASLYALQAWSNGNEWILQKFREQYIHVIGK